MCGWLKIPSIFDGHISSNGPVSVAMFVFRNVYGGGSVQEGDGWNMWRDFTQNFSLKVLSPDDVPEQTSKKLRKWFCLTQTQWCDAHKDKLHREQVLFSSASGKYHEFMRSLCMVHINTLPVLSTVALELGMMCFTTLKAKE